MNDDERLEQELRATLDTLAREPAPDRLVDRVAEIPRREPATRSRGIRPVLSLRSLDTGFGLLAAAVAVAIVVVLARPGAAPPSVGASPSTGPSAPTSSSSPAGTAPAVGTPSAVTAPSQSPEGASVPAGFNPMSATWVSADEGWVLGSIPCDGGRCPAIVRTEDGGATWAAIDAPKTAVGSWTGGEPPVNGSGISSLRFADQLDGWAFAPELWATHDGGSTWTRIEVAGLPAGSVVTALEAARGTVHAVLYDANQDFRIASSPRNVDDWSLAAVRVAVGAGPVPTIQLVLSGTSGWVLENDRTVVGGARLEAGTWRAWQPACLDVVGPALLAASSATDLVAVCDVGLMSTPLGEQVFVSTDGGTSFTKTGTRPLSSAAAVASPERSTIVVAGSESNGSEIVASFDGGGTWARTLATSGVTFTDLGFTTQTQGIVITTQESGVSRLLMTHDAGRTWTPVGF
jgi:photosystem II stability/assembly factor-like uncharacterized protein